MNSTRFRYSIVGLLLIIAAASVSSSWGIHQRGSMQVDIDKIKIKQLGVDLFIAEVMKGQNPKDKAEWQAIIDRIKEQVDNVGK
jgi:hypothetical protein